VICNKIDAGDDGETGNTINNNKMVTFKIMFTFSASIQTSAGKHCYDVISQEKISKVRLAYMILQTSV